MTLNISGQSVYVWTYVIIFFTIHAPLVHSRPSLTKPSVTDVTSGSLKQEQTTSASSVQTQGQTTTTLLEKETTNTVVWQLHPFATSENGGDSNSSINLQANSNTDSCYGDKDERGANCSTEENLDDSIDRGKDDYNNNIKDSDVNYDCDVNVDNKNVNGGNSNNNNSNNNKSNNNNNNSSNNKSNNNNNNNMEDLNAFNNSSEGYGFTNDFNSVYSYSINSSNTTKYSDKNNDDFYLPGKDTNDITTIQNLDNVTYSNIQIKNQSNVCTTKMMSSTEHLTDLAKIYYTFRWYSYIVIHPILGVLGLIGNVLSGIVATRQGLNKATNVFILTLAVADSFTLIHCINWASLVRFFPVYVAWYHVVWEYPPALTYFCYIITILTDTVLILSGSIISGYICTLIAIERVLAVCLPFHFKTIMTSRRAWIFTICTFLVWIFVAVYYAIVTSALNICYFPSLDLYLSWIQNKQNSVAIYIDAYFVTPISKILPVVVTVVGSLIIGVKVKDAERRRKGMTNLSKDKTSELRTTKTLMLVCGVFVFTQCAILPGYVFHYLVEEPLYRYFFVQIMSITQFVNASINFLIYVVFNNKFRAELKLLFSCCSKARGGNNGTTRPGVLRKHLR